MELSPDQTKIIFTLFNGSRYTEITDQKGYRKTRPFEVLAFKKFVRLFIRSIRSAQYVPKGLIFISEGL